MFDTLSDRLERISGKLRSRGRVSAADLDEALGEIRTALLEADVELGVVQEFLAAVREDCADLERSKSLTPGQQVVKAVHEQLRASLGGEDFKISYASRPPTVVLLAGLQGVGKTTNAAKLARWFKEQGRNPLLVAVDLQRPAAVEQLRVLGEQISVPVFSDPSSPTEAARLGIEEARRLGRDVVVVDTAGRLAIDEELMAEVAAIGQVTSPDYTFLVVDAMSGQDAAHTARRFHDALAIDGVIMTKLDGDARGGAALSVKSVVGRPIVFGSTGEKLDEFDLFHPDRMADRILGMGDILSLIEQAERQVDKEVAARSASRLMSGEFTLDDFLDQLAQVRKMGSMGGLMKLMPGMNKQMREAADGIDDRQVNRVEAVVRSMTPTERSNPVIIDGSRRTRIARGSGTSVQEVNQLLKQFEQMKKMMKSMAGGAMPNIPGLGGGIGGALKARKAMASMGETDVASLEAMMGRGAPAAPVQQRKAQPGKKKKKGGRVTPPKQR